MTDGTLVSEIDNSLAVNTFGGSNRYFSFIQNSVEKRYELDGSLVQATDTTSQYNDYGNPTQITVAYGDGHTETTVNTYTNDTAKWLLGQLTRAKVTKSAPGQPAQTRISTFGYNTASGLLIKEIIEPSHPTLRLKKRYWHDAYGNIKKSQISGPGIETRSQNTQYDAQGRFAVQNTNALNHTETRTYDARLGNVLSVTGPNNLTTSWAYDGFGRQIQESRADGTQTNHTYQLCENASCPAGARYLVYKQSSGQSPSVTYLDLLDRTIRSETLGFDGREIYVDTVYDERGQVTRFSEPYFKNDSPLWTTFQYDVIGRVLTETSPGNRVKTVTYQGLTTRTANALNQINIRSVNQLGQLVESRDNLNGRVTYSYDSFGNLIQMQDPAGNVTTMTYDVRGHQTSMVDPDTGTTTYQYNALGELISQSDAKGNTIQMLYDKLGRMIERQEPEGTSTWLYDTKPRGMGKLATVSGADGYQMDQTYDDLGRLSQKTTTIDGQDYTIETAYDLYSRLESITYPTGFAVKHSYNANGYLSDVRNAANNSLYWQAENLNARGQLETATLGNGLSTTRSYDANTGWVQTIQSGNGGAAAVQNLSYAFDAIGNLTSRSDLNQNLTETFVYDGLNRLTSATVSGQTPKTVSYDGLGNITFKSDVGTYTYGANGAGPHAVTSVSGVKNHTYTYDANGNRIGSSGGTVGYTSFNKPHTITDAGSTIEFTYGPEHSRYKRVTTTDNTVTTLLYVGGLYEQEYTGGLTKHIHYIRAGGESIAVYTQQSDGLHSTRYLHKDHLGSVDAITDESGNVVERLSFDAWGKRRTIDWQDATDFITSSINRGFTGHEQLDLVSLIHMNGRVYDPELGRFLSADPFVQAPTNSQSLNRYSYVLNNPLSHTDPSGFFFKKVFKEVGQFFKKHWRTIASIGVGAITAWYGAGIGSIVSPMGAAVGAGAGFGFGSAFSGTLFAGGSVRDALKTGLRAGLIGGVTARAVYKVGILIQPGLTKIAAHGVVGGTSTVLEGGKFEHGFVSAAFTHAFAPIINEIDSGNPKANVYRTAAAAVVGGTASELGGGKFANGAVTGGFVRLFADELYRREGRIVPGVKLLRKDISLEKGDKAYGHWWIELVPEDDSYAWWPGDQVDIKETLFGTEGSLNKGFADDPYHGKRGADIKEYNVIYTNSMQTRAEIIAGIRNFSLSYKGNWSWPIGQNCHSFQNQLLQHVGLRFTD